MGRTVARTGQLDNPEFAAFSLWHRSFRSQEWLSDLLFYKLSEWGGVEALCLTPALAALAAGLVLRALTRDEAPEGPDWARLGASLLALSVAAMRFQPRPHLVDLVAVPWAVLAARRLDASPNPARWALGLVLTQALWAQLHGSFVLLPAVVAITWLDPARRLKAGWWRWPLVTLAGVCLAALSNPLHFGAFQNIVTHAGGDATRFIDEMQPARWADLDPALSGSPMGLWWAAMLLVLAAGAVRGVRPRPADLARFLLGLALFATARRFFGLAALLNVAWMARALGAQRELPATAMAWLVATLGLVSQHTLARATAYERVGYGINRGFLPVESVDAIAALNHPGHLWNEYADGGWIEYRLGAAPRPRVSVLIDGRTPPYFDADLFFAARLSAAEPAAWDALSRRYTFDHILVRRAQPLCVARLHDPAWVIAYVDPLRVYFVPRGSAAARHPLRVLGSCETDLTAVLQRLNTPTLCAEAQSELGALSTLTPGAAYLDLVAAAIGARCGAPERALAPLARRCDDAYQNPGLATASAWIALELGQNTLAARCGAEALAREVNPQTLSLAGALAVAAQDYPLARDRYADAVARAGDDAPWGLRLDYARALAASGDTAEALDQARRAQVTGAGARAVQLLRALGAAP